MTESMDVFVGQVPVLLENIGSYLSGLPLLLVGTLLGVPVLVALLARQFICFLATLLLGSITLAMWAAPGSVATTLLIGAYFGALLAAFSAIGIRRKRTKDRSDLGNLKSEIADLSAAEQRRFLLDLKTGMPKSD